MGQLDVGPSTRMVGSVPYVVQKGVESYYVSFSF